MCFLWAADYLEGRVYWFISEAKTLGGGQRELVCKGSMCGAMTMRRWARKEPLIGTCLPWGLHSRLIGHPFTRQWSILLTANQPITSSGTGGLLAARQCVQALSLGQGSRPCHRIITMMNMASALWHCHCFWQCEVGVKWTFMGSRQHDPVWGLEKRCNMVEDHEGVREGNVNLDVMGFYFCWKEGAARMLHLTSC